ncbi:hypothetical protein PHYSODRAFT_338003 [Phytophthora sojae]|uniref:Uncharacterized protein n=1 Tax=Phytophthora sojae (strain P6497) TaxID=1094619 RepID=G5A038_PHYSP|nr:hypothetical protein PHYSODRAFT_338003 [Phytophthora sojae]EGZ11281.1 hypothetical protein PHYSODRAFT_338003 [Phytophthora sojae]|eukprot:XP_009534026.1 hypothetical protein PHYSODRAFT_338003 [Phytophthora sojae]
MTIDDDILAFCNHIKTYGLSPTGSPPGVAEVVDENTELNASYLELGAEINQPLDFDNTTAMDLPPLEEALDFLISVWAKASTDVDDL